MAIAISFCARDFKIDSTTSCSYRERGGQEGGYVGGGGLCGGGRMSLEEIEDNRVAGGMKGMREREGEKRMDSRC